MKTNRRLQARLLACIAFVLPGILPAFAQQPDLILTNGKIVTVDDRFRIAQAVAIKGERIVAVGDSRDIARLAGPGTRRLDLHGRTVIPGLIDNHTHFIRAAEYWHQEVRLDGVATRKLALETLRARAAAAKPGEWITVLGGWSEQQFTDEQRPFTKAELDAIAPNNPLLLQLIYFRIYANSAGLKALGIDDKTPDPRGGKIEKDAAGQPSGVLNGGGAVRMALLRLGEVSVEQATANARVLLADLNRMGMTSFIDYGGRGFIDRHFEPFRELARRHELTLRVYHAMWIAPEAPAEVDPVLARIRDMKPFQGDDWFDQVGYGETIYFPLHDNLLAKEAHPSPEQMREWKRVVQAVADSGMNLNVHAQLRGSIEAFLTALEEVNKVKPIRGMRWSFSHADQLEMQDIERIRKLGMYLEIHSRPSIQGKLMHDVHGDRAWDMPPLRMIQDSGVPWGLGSDATAVTPSSPFYTLGWAVTGKMLGGAQIGRQKLSREEALIAHTRSNAYFSFREADLGSIQNGKYADLVVLDRDYLKVPADEIKDIKPLATMVGGKFAYDALATAPASGNAAATGHR